jgi:DNA-binding NtrC family response regulator
MHVADHLGPTRLNPTSVSPRRSVESKLLGREAESPARQIAASSELTTNQTDNIPHARVEALRNLTLALLREVVALSELSESGEGSGLNLACEVQRFEADLIRLALVQTAGKQRRAARLLGVKITTLHRNVKHYKINIEEIQHEAARSRGGKNK